LEGGGPSWFNALFFSGIANMPISVTCASCGAKLRAPDNAAGRKLACSKCKAAIVVPADPTSQSLMASRPATGNPPVATKQCPFCSEPVLAAAKKCKHCGETIDVALRAAEESERAARQSIRRRRDEDDYRDDAPHRSTPPPAAAAASTTVIMHGESKASFPHMLHFILTLVTCGIWTPIWLLHAMFRAR
jgi:hypothetical protein